MAGRIAAGRGLAITYKMQVQQPTKTFCNFMQKRLAKNIERPPIFSCPSGKLGILSSMFTNPNYRRNGIAKELLHRVVEEARNYGCGAVQITASDMGVKLYTAYGFVHNDNYMQYKL